VFDRRLEVDVTPARLGWQFWLALVSSALLLVVNAFEWSLVDLLTPFLFSPLQFAVWLLFLGSAVLVAGAFLFGGQRGYLGAAPIVLSVVVGIVVLVTPFTDLWLAANYRWYRSDRERVVRQVQEGKLVTSGGVVALPPSEPYMSAGGNEIVVEEHDGRRYVFFYSYRGILDNYSGFLFVPEGGSPREFSDLAGANSTRVRQLGPRWFFASHW